MYNFHSLTYDEIWRKQPKSNDKKMRIKTKNICSIYKCYEYEYVASCHCIIKSVLWREVEILSTIVILHLSSKLLPCNAALRFGHCLFKHFFIQLSNFKWEMRWNGIILKMLNKICENSIQDEIYWIDDIFKLLSSPRPHTLNLHSNEPSSIYIESYLSLLYAQAHINEHKWTHTHDDNIVSW